MQKKNNTKFRIAQSERELWRSGGTPRTVKGVINDCLSDNAGNWSHNGEKDIIS